MVAPKASTAEANGLGLRVLGFKGLGFLGFKGF